MLGEVFVTAHGIEMGVSSELFLSEQYAYTKYTVKGQLVFARRWQKEGMVYPSLNLTEF